MNKYYYKTIKDIKFNVKIGYVIKPREVYKYFKYDLSKLYI